MTEKYFTLAGETETVKIIEKSRFITTSRRIESEDGARKFIAEIAKKYPDATHNCYAFIADKLGNFLRFSDDGEPQGTAGMPIIEVIKSKNLKETAVVVTRYFGGIKLGAGGLVRAYSGCAAENLDAAEKAVCEPCVEVKIKICYQLAESVLRCVSSSGASLLNTEYSDGVKVTAAVKKSEKEKFLSSLINLSNGKADYEITKEYFSSFKI